MKIKLASIAVILLIFGAFVTGTAAANADACDEKVLYVSGTGSVATAPDRATISLAVQTENENVVTAQQQNAVIMDDVINALKAIGLSSEDLETTGYNIIRLKEDSDELWKSDVAYYRVTNTLVVTLKDLDLVGEAIDTAVDAGANQVNYIAFSLSEEKQLELRSEALIAAVRQARGDADAVAGALGMSVTGVKEVQVAGGYIPLQYADAAFAEEAIAARVPTPVIEPSTLDVTATVSITYLLN